MAESSARKKTAGPRILAMGVGGSGTHAIARLVELNPSIQAVAVDTDTRALESSCLKQVIQVGGTVTNGFSAGGDVELGRQSVEKDSSNIRELLRQTDLLILVVGLGGGCGSGGAPVVARIAREAKTLVLCLLTTPFAFEGKSAAVKSQDAIKKLRTHADALVMIPNEALIGRSEKELAAEEALARGQQVISDGVLGLWRVLANPGICGLDFASLHTMLRNCDGFCHFAHMEAEGEQRQKEVASGIVKHTLLNGGKVLQKASGVIVGLTGGQDLRLSEVQSVMNAIQEKLPQENLWLNFGIVVDPAFEGRLSAVILVAEAWKEPLMADEIRKLGFSFSTRIASEQGELPLEMSGKGRFDNLDPTIHGNQDLDVPTYIRRNIKLPR